MKLLLLILLPLLSFGQPREPFKRANLVLVTFESVSADDAFNAVGRTLIDEGYTISKSDKNFMSIETNARNFTGKLADASTSVLVRASIKTVGNGRTEVKLSGVFNVVGDTDPPMEITFRGMKGSSFMVAFNKLQEVATRIATNSPGQITYAFQ